MMQQQQAFGVVSPGMQPMNMNSMGQQGFKPPPPAAPKPVQGNVRQIPTQPRPGKDSLHRQFPRPPDDMVLKGRQASESCAPDLLRLKVMWESLRNSDKHGLVNPPNPCEYNEFIKPGQPWEGIVKVYGKNIWDAPNTLLVSPAPSMGNLTNLRPEHEYHGEVPQFRHLLAPLMNHLDTYGRDSGESDAGNAKNSTADQRDSDKSKISQGSDEKSTDDHGNSSPFSMSISGNMSPGRPASPSPPEQNVTSSATAIEPERSSFSNPFDDAVQHMYDTIDANLPPSRSVTPVPPAVVSAAAGNFGSGLSSDGQTASSFAGQQDFIAMTNNILKDEKRNSAQGDGPFAAQAEKSLDQTLNPPLSLIDAPTMLIQCKDHVEACLCIHDLLQNFKSEKMVLFLPPRGYLGLTQGVDYPTCFHGMTIFFGNSMTRGMYGGFRNFKPKRDGHCALWVCNDVDELPTGDVLVDSLIITFTNGLSQLRGLDAKLRRVALPGSKTPLILRVVESPLTDVITKEDVAFLRSDFPCLSDALPSFRNRIPLEEPWFSLIRDEVSFIAKDILHDKQGEKVLLCHEYGENMRWLSKEVLLSKMMMFRANHRVPEGKKLLCAALASQTDHSGSWSQLSNRIAHKKYGFPLKLMCQYAEPAIANKLLLDKDNCFKYAWQHSDLGQLSWVNVSMLKVAHLRRADFQIAGTVFKNWSPCMLFFNCGIEESYQMQINYLATTLAVAIRNYPRLMCPVIQYVCNHSSGIAGRDVVMDHTRRLHDGSLSVSKGPIHPNDRSQLPLLAVAPVCQLSLSMLCSGSCGPHDMNACRRMLPPIQNVIVFDSIDPGTYCCVSGMSLKGYKTAVILGCRRNHCCYAEYALRLIDEKSGLCRLCKFFDSWHSVHPMDVQLCSPSIGSPRSPIVGEGRRSPSGYKLSINEMLGREESPFSPRFSFDTDNAVSRPGSPDHEPADALDLLERDPAAADAFDGKIQEDNMYADPGQESSLVNGSYPLLPPAHIAPGSCNAAAAMMNNLDGVSVVSNASPPASPQAKGATKEERIKIEIANALSRVVYLDLHNPCNVRMLRDIVQIPVDLAAMKLYIPNEGWIPERLWFDNMNVRYDIYSNPPAQKLPDCVNTSTLTLPRSAADLLTYAISGGLLTEVNETFVRDLFRYYPLAGHMLLTSLGVSPHRDHELNVDGWCQSVRFDADSGAIDTVRFFFCF